MNFVRASVFTVSFALFLGGAALQAAQTSDNLKLEKHQKLITLLQTNDIHGRVEPIFLKEAKAGGFTRLNTMVQGIRKGLEKQYGSQAGVLLLDGGDQFQGTLLSNYDEGLLVIDLMNRVGYDAAVPGNHAYDFGPLGWEIDQAKAPKDESDLRGAFERAAKGAKFAYLSANTFYKKSLKSRSGKTLDPDSSSFRETDVDWSQARTLGFLRPSIIKEIAGVRVALIGIDHKKTPMMTTAANVSDLYFRNEVSAYLAERERLSGKADVFVLVMHLGNILDQKEANEYIQQLIKNGKAFADAAKALKLKVAATDRGQVVDAVVAGHTHSMNDEKIEGIPLVQSGSNGAGYSRTDLVFDTKTRNVIPAQTRTFAGVLLWPTGCDRKVASFCEGSRTDSKVVIEGVETQDSEVLAERIAEAREKLGPIGARVLGKAKETIYKHRYSENAMTNILVDDLRKSAKVEIALINTGGVRDVFRPGPVTYEDFFLVMPFNNRAVHIGPLSAKKIFALLTKSAKTCGKEGALLASGLVAVVEKDCEERGKEGIDFKGKILKLSLGTMADANPVSLYDEAKGGWLVDQERSFYVATLDFLHAGGSGYSEFIGAPLVEDLGIARDVLANTMSASPQEWTNAVDGRWKVVAPAAP